MNKLFYLFFFNCVSQLDINKEHINELPLPKINLKNDITIENINDNDEYHYDLYSDNNFQIGDLVTVIIPEDFQINKEEIDKNSIPQSNIEFIKKIKMEIIDISNKNVVLKHTKILTPSDIKITVDAIIDRNNIKNEIDANLLHHINLKTSNNNNDYYTIDWDKTLTRKISNFYPNIEKETSELESFRKDLIKQRKSIQQQWQALREAQNKFNQKESKQ